MLDFMEAELAIRQARKEKKALLAEQNRLSTAIEEAKDHLIETSQLKAIVITVSNQTQLFVAERISSLVSLALHSTGFDYDFKVDFVQRRNTTEADLFFVKDGNEMNPLNCSGGGALDIASFALRIALWSMKKSSSIFILDEPFKHLSIDRQAKAGKLLHELADKFGLQIVMVSHNPEIVYGADHVITL